MLLDVKKAFDTVSHDSVARALRRFGLAETFSEYVMAANTNCSTRVSIGKNLSNPIKINRGVKQGDPLSPLLFNMVLDKILVELDANFGGISVGGQKITALAYADDMALYAETPAEAQAALRTVASFCEARGLSLSAKKCSAITAVRVPHKGKHHK